ncbi:MAG: peptidoglycan DD-metalloendopeptidase family protein [Candidatus Moraniibacteriota bacterium]
MKKGLLIIVIFFASFLFSPKVFATDYYFYDGLTEDYSTIPKTYTTMDGYTFNNTVIERRGASSSCSSFILRYAGDDMTPHYQYYVSTDSTLLIYFIETGSYKRNKYFQGTGTWPNCKFSIINANSLTSSSSSAAKSAEFATLGYSNISQYIKFTNIDIPYTGATHDFGSQYNNLGTLNAGQIIRYADVSVCNSWTYSDWGACQQNNTQTRTILTSSPSGCSGGSPVLTQSCTYTVPLTVSPDPVAGGGVASSDDEIQCGVNQYNYCQYNYPLNTDVELTAYPNAGFAFAYWEWNGGANSSTNNPETFTMDGALGVTAKFYLNLKLPLSGSKNWLLYVAAGGDVQCNGGTDQYHTGNGYYSLDFSDDTSEDGHLAGTDVPILAAAYGAVSYAGGDPNSGYGYTVVIDHGGTYETRYAHLKYSPTISGTVTQGQQIGVMGSTGISTGIHLHFQVYYNSSSNSTIPELGTVLLENLNLEDYIVGCSNDNPPTGFYYSSN